MSTVSMQACLSKVAGLQRDLTDAESFDYNAKEIKKRMCAVWDRTI